MHGYHLTTSRTFSVTIWNNHSNAEIAFYIAAKTWFVQLKDLSDAAVLSRFGHILNRLPLKFNKCSGFIIRILWIFMGDSRTPQDGHLGGMECTLNFLEWF